VVNDEMTTYFLWQLNCGTSFFGLGLRNREFEILMSVDT